MRQLFAVCLAAALPAAAAAKSLMPNIADDTRPLGDERKYFVFHQGGVSLDQARADFRYCFRYTRLGGGIVFPYFLPLEGSSGNAKPLEYDFGGQYGLVGVAIGAIISGPIERSKRQISMMRCMLPRGYARYRISEGLWKELNGENIEAAIEAQAQIASGPVPSTPKVLP